MKKLILTALLPLALLTAPPTYSSYGSEPRQVTRENNKSQEISAEALRLSEIVKEKCQELGVAYPVNAAELQTAESRAFVSEAINQAVTAFTNTHGFKVITHEKKVVVRITFTPLYTESGVRGDPETMVREYEKNPLLENLGTVLGEVLKVIFEREMQLEYDLQVNKDDTTAIAQLGGATSHDLLQEAIQNQKIDYKVLWYRIRDVVGQGMKIAKEETSGGGYILYTAPHPSEDNNWLYQSYFQIR